MTLFVLDTDILTLFAQGNEVVVANAESVAADRLAVPIIVVEEVLGGWYSQLRKVKNDAHLVRVYAELQRSVELFRRVQILPFDAPAALEYRRLRTEYRRSGKNDLRIAAIALCRDAVVVTRNQSDFRDIGGIRILDWSIATQKLPEP